MSSMGPVPDLVPRCRRKSSKHTEPAVSAKYWTFRTYKFEHPSLQMTLFFHLRLKDLAASREQLAIFALFLREKPSQSYWLELQDKILFFETEQGGKFLLFPVIWHRQQ
jgi:hypothetical protein